MKFTKWQGCGNDFMLIDCREKEPEDYAQLSRAMCDRHYGIGGDGLLVVLPSDKADFRMRIFNTDGSEAEMCGNGIRCFARYLYDYGLTQKQEFTVETGAGILVPKLALQDGKVISVTVDMGEPILSGDEIPVAGFGKGKVLDADIKVDGKVFTITCVSMGNPHAVVFVENMEKADLEHFGPLFESHELFPRKTNTEFVLVRDPEHVRMRVWERGAAITLACGTGSCATVVAGALTGRTARKAEVELDGGKLLVEWAEKDNHVYMTGPAEFVFEGTYDV